MRGYFSMWSPTFEKGIFPGKFILLRMLLDTRWISGKCLISNAIYFHFVNNPRFQCIHVHVRVDDHRCVYSASDRVHVFNGNIFVLKYLSHAFLPHMNQSELSRTVNEMISSWDPSIDHIGVGREIHRQWGGIDRAVDSGLGNRQHSLYLAVYY